MLKPAIMMATVGALIATGIVLSFYGSQVITEGLSHKEELVMSGGLLEVFSDIDATKTSLGVYVVQVQNFKEGSVHVKVFDPLGTEIVSTVVDRESFEQRFDVATSGTYKLIVENTGQEQTQMVAVIGPMPDAGKLSFGITGFYILIVGLIGIVGVGIYSIRNRRKKTS
jgi:putative ubiquitin-RnfH superfamily antitoxin RatB of RatAB toxin-antitoxin module